MTSTKKDRLEALVESVPCWSVVRGVGHVVTSRDDSSPLGTHTACGMVGNMRGFQAETPDRVCKLCFASLTSGSICFVAAKPGRDDRKTGDLFGEPGA